MEGSFESGALETLVAITGASEAVGARLLQATGGDLNAAVNTFYNEGDEPLPPTQRNDERNDWMDEDEPVVGIPMQSIVPFGPVPLPVSPWSNADLTLSTVGGHDLPYGRAGVPRVVHPPDVRNVPIDWHDDDDDDDDDDASSYPRISPSHPQIEEVPSDADIQELAPTHQAMMDDELPSTASSAFRSGGESTEARRFSGPTFSDDDLDPDFSLNAPRVVEAPEMSGDEGIDIEEEMLRAAIEASKREAEATMRGTTDYLQETATGANPAERFPSTRTIEDDDLARAVTLSLKTAEEEKALRERGGAPSGSVMMQEEEGNSVPDEARKNMRRRGVARDRTGAARGSSANVGGGSSVRERDRRTSGSSVAPIIIGSADELEEVEEQPLLRRRTSRRSHQVTAQTGFGGGEGQSRIPRGAVDGRELPILPNASSIGPRDEVGVAARPQLEGRFPSDEWGGISSEEHDEAVMLEAALFGGLPERAGRGMSYHSRRGIHNDVMDALVGGDASNLMDAFGRRGFPQPPSPTVVAQRLIREQQDDEYLASLAADREKELKAEEEERVRRLKEQEAAEAAASQEKIRLEQELRKQQEAEDLEKQLALKKESLPCEPAAEEQGALTLVVRLPDGSRRGRRFHKSNKLQSLFDFIDIGGGVKPGTYRLVRQYPRVAFTDAEHASSLEDLGLTSKQEVLLLELI